MKTLLKLQLALLVWGGISCSPSYKLLKTKQDPSFSLANYRTYGFFEVDVQGDTVPARFTENLAVIKDAISTNLEKRGLSKSASPDLKINLAITVREKVQTRQTDFRTDGYPRYMGQRRYSWKSEEVEVGRYKEGTLLIDLVDARQNVQVWQGGGEGVVREKGDIREGLNEMIARIIAEIP